MKWEARKRRSGDYQGCSSKPGNCESGPLRAREPDPSSLALGGTLEEIPVGRSASQPPGSIPGVVSLPPTDPSGHLLYAGLRGGTVHVVRGCGDETDPFWPPMSLWGQNGAWQLTCLVR